jgi:nicotinate phosphoribosyltransferase
MWWFKGACPAVGQPYSPKGEKNMEHSLQTHPMVVDLYELTMAQSYFHENMTADATFSLFIRKYPENRGYFVNAGLADAVHFLERMHYSQENLDYLDSTGLFTQKFLHCLSTVTFEGSVHAMPEGRIFFTDEPVIEVTAPIIQGQLAETAIINAFNLQVTLATKIARCVTAAGRRRLVDFSLRRAQGGDAGFRVARSGCIAGMAATSNVLAGKVFGIPLSGTMAHSFVTAFSDELSAFRAYARLYGDETVLLIDTYDTLNGAFKAVQVAREMACEGRQLKAVRLDSGDMISLSRRVRQILDEAGFERVKIFASGSFDEYKIDRFVKEDAPVDAFGVGTRMGVSSDAPYTDMAYKLVAYDGRPVLKLSSGKQTLVSAKQVCRSFMSRAGAMIRDCIALRGESVSGKPLLDSVIKGGKRCVEKDSLNVMRDRFQSDLNSLPKPYRSLVSPEHFPVDLSPALEALQKQTVDRVRQRELNGTGSMKQ